MIVADKPGAPTSPQVIDVDSRSVTLSWTAPKDDGGSPLLGYVVDYRPEGGFRWDRANVDEDIVAQRYIVKGLRDKHMYDFRIAARNKAGVGEFVECSKPVEVHQPISK